MTVIRGGQVQYAQALVLAKALKLEIRGMRRRGRSAYSIVKEKFGLKGSRERVLEQLEQALEHDCWDEAIQYRSDGPIGHGWECGVCGAFLQAG